MDKFNREILKKSPGKIINKIIGFGNRLMSDDAIGPLIIDELRKDASLASNENIILIDGETVGIDLIFMVNEDENVIIIDAIDAGQKTGEVISFDIQDVETFNPQKISSYSLHDIDLATVFNIMKALNIKINAQLIGIKPKSVDFGTELSKEIKLKIPEIIKTVKKHLIFSE